MPAKNTQHLVTQLLQKRRRHFAVFTTVASLHCQGSGAVNSVTTNAVRVCVLYVKP